MTGVCDVMCDVRFDAGPLRELEAMWRWVSRGVGIGFEDSKHFQ